MLIRIGVLKQVVAPREEVVEPRVSKQPDDVSSVVEWLCNLGLAKYEEVFVREEIDWDTLQWLTEEVYLLLHFMTLIGAIC